MPWKLDREATSLAELTVHRDGAFVLGDDSVHHRQPEPQSFADFFRGEEGFEDPPAGIRFHAHAIIGDAKADKTTGRRADRRIIVHLPGHVLEGNLKSPSIRHGVTGIHAEVHQRLEHLSRIGVHQPDDLGGGRVYHDARIDRAL